MTRLWLSKAANNVHVGDGAFEMLSIAYGRFGGRGRAAYHRGACGVPATWLIYIYIHIYIYNIYIYTYMHIETHTQ